MRHDDFLENKNQDPDFLYTVINILFQIYSVLSVLQYEFTHYDLHPKNVLLYKVSNDGYITMNYTNFNNCYDAYLSAFNSCDQNINN